MTGAGAVAECLKAQGVEIIFGIRGLHVTAVAEAAKERGIRFIESRHEQSAAFMADAYARVTGKVGFVLAGTGAGAACTSVGMQEAYCSSSPVLLIVSEIDQRYLQKGWGEVHEVKSQHGLLSSVTAACYDVAAGSDIPECLRTIFTRMAHERPRSYGLEVPVDILNAELAAPIPYQPIVRTPTLPDCQRLAEAVEMLVGARRPVIYAGGGAISSGAGHAIRRLAERLNAPVLTSIKGKGVLSEAHDLSLGNLGTEGPVQALLETGDLAIVVGTRFSSRSTGKWSLRLPSRWIRVDIDEQQFARTHPDIQGNPVIELVGDARVTLERMLEQLEAPSPRPQGPRSESRTGFEHSEVIGAKRQALETVRAKSPAEMKLLNDLRGAMRDNAILANDSTMATYWTRRYFEVRRPRTFLWAMGSGTIGFGLPAAIGAKLAYPDRQVLALCGDGGFLFSCQELATAVKYRAAVVVVLFNNNAFGIVDHGQRKTGHLFGDEALVNPDFITLARAFGADAERIESLEVIGEVVEKALVRNRLTVIEVPAALHPSPDLA